VRAFEREAFSPTRSTSPTCRATAGGQGSAAAEIGAHGASEERPGSAWLQAMTTGDVRAVGSGVLAYIEFSATIRGADRSDRRAEGAGT